MLKIVNYETFHKTTLNALQNFKNIIQPVKSLRIFQRIYEIISQISGIFKYYLQIT